MPTKTISATNADWNKVQQAIGLLDREKDSVPLYKIAAGVRLTLARNLRVIAEHTKLVEEQRVKILKAHDVSQDAAENAKQPAKMAAAVQEVEALMLAAQELELEQVNVEAVATKDNAIPIGVLAALAPILSGFSG